MAFTYFFRDIQTLELVVKHMVPRIAGRAAVRVWDAGCASGQEPYTLAILLAEAMGRFAYRNLRIEASDIDGSNLFGNIIAKGIYPREELERIPPALLAKYFRQLDGGGGYQLDGRVRGRLNFSRHDLLSLTPLGRDFAAVVCKNVLLHFQPDQRVEVIKMFHEALEPGGLLATEQTQKMPGELAGLFEQVTESAQLFRKVG